MDFLGVRLLDDLSRVTIPLWTDASNQGLGAYYKTSSQSTLADIPEQQAFAIWANKRLGGKHINIKETVAVLCAIERWGPLWGHTRLNIHTDSSTVFTGLSEGSIRSRAMAQWSRSSVSSSSLPNMIYTSSLTGSQVSKNRLADALSRFYSDTIANMCPHWQNLSLLKSLRASEPK